MSRLERLERLQDEFVNFRALQNYFIGALSVVVGDAVWDECLKDAEMCADIYKEPRTVAQGDKDENKQQTNRSVGAGRASD